jgi:phage FluMu protein Com
MPYMRCPGCGLLAHMGTDGSPPVYCPRCKALQHEVRLRPVEESLRLDHQAPAESPYGHSPDD